MRSLLTLSFLRELSEGERNAPPKTIPALIIIMFLLGGLGLSQLTSSFGKTIVSESLNTYFEDTSLNYYTLTEESLDDFDEYFLDNLMIEIKIIPLTELNEERIEIAFETAFLKSIDTLTSTLLSRFNEIDESIVLDDLKYLELYNAVMFSFSNLVEPDFDFYDVEMLVGHLNDSDYLNIILTGNDPNNLYDVALSSERNLYRLKRARTSSATYLKTLMTNEDIVNTLLLQFEDLGITEEVYLSFGFDELGLVNIANTAILTYQARIDYEISMADPNEDILIIKDRLKANISANFLASLPEEMTSMLSGMEDQDMYASTMISMYYKIVGMLVAIVYIIMVSVLCEYGIWLYTYTYFRYVTNRHCGICLFYSISIDSINNTISSKQTTHCGSDSRDK